MANTTNLQFRIATLDDADQLQQLVQAAFRAEDIRPSWTDDLGLSRDFRMNVEEIISKINQPDSVYLVATDSNGALVATIGIYKRGDDLVRFANLAVDDNYQRGGIGRQVLTYAEDYTRKTWNVKKIGLNAVSTREELISWYVRYGFQKTGETSPFPVEHFKGLALPEDLHFVELEKDLDTVSDAASAA